MSVEQLFFLEKISAVFTASMGSTQLVWEGKTEISSWEYKKRGLGTEFNTKLFYKITNGLCFGIGMGINTANIYDVEVNIIRNNNFNVELLNRAYVNFITKIEL